VLTDSRPRGFTSKTIRKPAGFRFYPTGGLASSKQGAFEMLSKIENPKVAVSVGRRVEKFVVVCIFSLLATLCFGLTGVLAWMGARADVAMPSGVAWLLLGLFGFGSGFAYLAWHNTRIVQPTVAVATVFKSRLSEVVWFLIGFVIYSTYFAKSATIEVVWPWLLALGLLGVVWALGGRFFGSRRFLCIGFVVIVFLATFVRSRSAVPKNVPPTVDEWKVWAEKIDRKNH
jgi:hypothetical protein